MTDSVDSTARDRILGRLRQAAGAPVAEAPLPVRRFPWNPVECLSRFSERLRAVNGEVIGVGPDWPERLAALLAARGVGNLAHGPEGPHGAELAAGWPADGPVALLPWREPVEQGRDRLFGAVDAAFTGCRGAVAETGSLVLWPTPAEPRLLSLVPPVHVVLLDPARIRSTFHELMAEETWSGGMPTNALLISGPSRSADIEQTLTYGVHGPRSLIVLVRLADGQAADF